MITVAELSSDRPLAGWDSESEALLSTVVLCRQPEGEASTRAIVERLMLYRPQIEIVVVIEPTLSAIVPASPLGAWCVEQGCRVIEPAVACGLPALRLNEGILAGHSQWVWLLDAGDGLPGADIDSLLQRLAARSAPITPVLVRPQDDAIFLAIPGVEPLWLDLLYKGRKFPFANVLFPRQVFDVHGLLEPHIAAASFYQQEFLHRIARFVEFEKTIEPGAAAVAAEQFPPLFYHWLDIDRQSRLQPGRVRDYAIDDLDQFQAGLPESERQLAFVHAVIPYYCRHRHRLPDGLPTTAQSVPARTQHVLCIKGDHYATTIDVTVRNFDVWAEGRRGYKLSHVFVSQIDSEQPVADDAILLERTVETAALRLMERFAAAGLPVGYALDDDLFHLADLGGASAAFRPGDPGYDAMVSTVRGADVVMCGGAHVEQVVRGVNPRTVQFDASVLPQFLPGDGERSDRTRPFKFGYAGGSYRVQEMQMLWPAIEKIRQEYGDDVKFEFWGLDPSQFSQNLRGIAFVPFSISYYEYLTRLRSAGFHAMLAPLLAGPAHRRGKLPVKVWETSVAGAVGLYSDVPTYQIVSRMHIGLSVAESTDAWYRAMRAILELEAGEYAGLRERALAFVREFYTTPAMLQVHEHGLAAILFHGATRNARDEDGRPSVLYVLSASEQSGAVQGQFARVIELAEQSGINPQVFQLSSAEALGRACESIRRRPVALVHMFGSNPELIRACEESNIPVVITLSGDASTDKLVLPKPAAGEPAELIHAYGLSEAERLGTQLRRHWFGSREVVPNHLFDLGFSRLYGRQTVTEPGRPCSIIAFGALEAENHVLELELALASIASQGREVTLTFYAGPQKVSGYAEECQQRAAELGLAGRLIFRDEPSDLGATYAEADILVSARACGSVAAIYEAMASGVQVVAWPQARTDELLQDEVNFIRAAGPQVDHLSAALNRAIRLTPAQRLSLCRNAFHLARQECHPSRGRLDLLSMYNTALQLRRTRGPGLSPASLGPTSPQQRGVRPERPPAGTVPLRHRLVYRIVPEHPDWLGLDVLIGTHQRQANGVLTLQVLSTAGQLVRRVTCDLGQVGDNDWLPIRFEPVVNADSQVFILEFRLSRRLAGPAISFYESSAPEDTTRLRLRRLGLITSGNTLYCRMWYAERG
jgi:hypothetical protein